MKKRCDTLKPNGKIHSFILPSVTAACLFLFLVVGGIYFNGYLQNRIFEERTTQLNEITSQVQANLNNALDSHWNYLTAAVNLLEQKEYSTVQNLIAGIGQMEALLETENYSSSLMLLDRYGNYYDADGKHGVWPCINMITGRDERYTFISESITGDGNYWAFVQKLQQPLRLRYVPGTHGPHQPVPKLPQVIFVRLQIVLEAVVLKAQSLHQPVTHHLSGSRSPPRCG